MIKKLLFAAAMLILAGGLTAQDVSQSGLKSESRKGSVLIPIPNIEASANEDNRSVDLSEYLKIPDATSEITYSASVIDPTVANIKLEDEELTIDFGSAGQTYVIASATLGSSTLTDTFAIGVRPVLSRVAGVTGFEENSLEANSFWNGSDESGGFASGDHFLFNDYSAQYRSWNGWAYSSVVNDTTRGLQNQYAAISNVRLDSAEGKNYAISYIFNDCVIVYADSTDHEIRGLFVTNSTYAALSMKYGDPYSKKFGGEDGNDPDFFKLTVSGIATNGDSSTVDFLLADYTSSDNSKDYLVETWQWVELSSLGAIYKLEFSLSSSDMGDWGMNTPASFCIDNIVTSYPTLIKEDKSIEAEVYPNPSDGVFTIETGIHKTAHVSVFDVCGRKVYDNETYGNKEQLDLRDQPEGNYFIKVSTARGNAFLRMIKQ